MTMRELGRVTPAQVYVLQLAGYVINRRSGIIADPSDQEIEESKANAVTALSKMTGQDFGYDVNAWIAYLIKSDHGFPHPYAFSTVRKRLMDVGISV